MGKFSRKSGRSVSGKSKIKKTGGVRATIKEVIPVNSIATKNYVNKKVRQEEETKYFDKAVTVAANADYAGSFFQALSGVTQGVGDTQRIGDKIRLRALQIRLSAAYNGGNAIMRLIVFQYRQQSALHAAAVTELLTSGYLSTPNAPNAPFTHDYKSFYKVLVDKHFTLDTTKEVQKQYIFRVPLKYAKKELAFSAGSTDAIGHIYLLLLSNLGATIPQALMVSRLFYDDA